MGIRFVRYVETQPDGKIDSRIVSFDDALRFFGQRGRPNNDEITEVGKIHPKLGQSGYVMMYTVTQGGKRYYTSEGSTGWTTDPSNLPVRSKSRPSVW